MKGLPKCADGLVTCRCAPSPVHCEVMKEIDVGPTVPEGYPSELEAAVVLDDGAAVTFRPILPEDGTEIARAYAEADADTLFHRFFTAAPNIGEKQIHYLSEVDYKRRLALVALDADGHGVGIARYESLTDPAQAEVAVVVHSEWRRRGIATELLGRLEDPALRQGITELIAVYLPENRAVARVFELLGYSSPRLADGLARVEKRIA